jgi:signal recognition particle GTPase
LDALLRGIDWIIVGKTHGLVMALKACRTSDFCFFVFQADVNVKFVKEMQDNIKKVVNFDDLAAGHNKRKIIQQVR